MTRISNALYYTVCRFKTAACSHCYTPLRGRPSISKRMSKRVNKKHTKYYCVPCAFNLHILTESDASEYGIAIPPEESA